MGNRPVLKRIIEIVVSLAAIAVLLVIFWDFWQEIVGIVLGYVVARIGVNILFTVQLLHEDGNKICTKDFNYDEKTYKRNCKIGEEEISLWFESMTEPTREAEYVIQDDPKKDFRVDTFIQSNFTCLIDAHQASYVENKNMIRLDDCEQDAEGRYVLTTSRTVFYNDLLTNRMMDYKFHGDLTLRALYEPGKYLTPLKESRLSNHIGINVIIFCGDKMLLPCRGGAATQTKKGVTSGIAIGLNEADVAKVLCGEGDHHPKIEGHGAFEKVIFEKLKGFTTFTDAEIEACQKDGSIKFYSLGFCRLIYNGGKPQFYYALCVDESLRGKFVLQKKEWKKQKAVDAICFYVFADGIALTKKRDGHILLQGANGGKDMVKKAEPSFFVNLWYIQQQPKKQGIPKWIYED
ncbi:MAG: hypothetical protein IJY11_02775 [Clostridia bacterium]|nr:hypothetical protein [Clostridia bacterium]